MTTDGHRDRRWAEVKGSLNSLFVLGFLFWVSLLLLPFVGPRRSIRYTVCLYSGHKWAEEERYGVEPVCLRCDKDRRQA